MSISLLDLEDRIITDTGSMVAKYQLLVNLALADKDILDIPYVDNDDVNRYHRYVKSTTTAKRWIDDGNMVGPPPSSYQWTTPEPYASIDVIDHCFTVATNRGFTTNAYNDRLTAELQRVDETNMYDFIRCLLWITDTMRENKLVWGVGRGSSCASLILFLLDINKVDPVKYDIPMEEFYK